ncbi:MAG: serine hydrolase, partial [Lachnospiraceae bacterium]|nr:serine hydrolase [Lachnospiraceae bacterium]
VKDVEQADGDGVPLVDGVRGASTDGADNAGDGSADAKKPVYHFASTADTVGIYSEEVISTNAILVDESTDTIIASKGADERICPASMTKVLTVLVAAEQITEDDLDDTFTMTLEITDYAYVNDCSSVGFMDGEKVTVRDLFYGTILPSGGDAALGLATYIAGSQEAFVEMMNARLEELGIGESAHFTNCIGLYDEEHYCTVYDMAVIMKAAMQNELCREVLSARTYTTVPTVDHPDGITISNWFLRKIEDKDTGGEMLCGKTGYVVQSRNCAVSYGTSAGGTPYICVTAGSTSSWRCIYDHVEIYDRYVPAGG